MVITMLQKNDSTRNETIQSSNDDDDQSDNNSSVGSENISQDGNAAWADCIANVLKSDKPKTKKSLVLSRAKNLNQIKEEKKSYDFEIEGEIKEEKPDKNETDEKFKTIKKEKYESKLKALSLRVKPSIRDRERERALRKIATRGVVQLFNAVRIQQKEIDKELEKAGPLDHRKDAVLNNIDKRKFLDVLMSGKRAKSELVDNPIKEEVKEESDNDNDDNEKKSEWSVLRDDFMTNKKFKNWDQQSEDSDNNENNKNDSDDFGGSGDDNDDESD